MNLQDPSQWPPLLSLAAGLLALIGLGFASERFANFCKHLTVALLGWQADLQRFAGRPWSIPFKNVGLGLIAAVALTMTAITNACVVGISVQVVFPIDQEYSYFAGAAFTLLWIGVEHVCLELLGLVRSFLPRIQSKRKRALLLVPCLLICARLLRFEYNLSYCRAKIIPMTGEEDWLDGGGTETEIEKTAQVAGGFAVAVALATGVCATGLEAAVRSLGVVGDVVLRASSRLLGIFVTLLAIGAQFAGQLARWPTAALAVARRGWGRLQAVWRNGRPLTVLPPVPLPLSPPQPGEVAAPEWAVPEDPREPERAGAAEHHGLTPSPVFVNTSPPPGGDGLSKKKEV
jgi:hypothetical protein